MTLNKIEHVQQLIKSLYFDSKKAHDYLFKDNLATIEDTKQEIIAGILLNKANSTFACLHTFYYCNLESVCDDRVENILSKFQIFSKEFLSNLSSHHSHQWTNLEFTNFEDSVKQLVSIPE